MLEVRRQEAYVNGRTYGEKRGIVIGFKDGEISGIGKGKEIGEKNKAIEIAKQLIKEGLSTEVIVKSTGLSKTVITKLLKAGGELRVKS